MFKIYLRTFLFITYHYLIKNENTKHFQVHPVTRASSRLDVLVVSGHKITPRNKYYVKYDKHNVDKHEHHQQHGNSLSN